VWIKHEWRGDKFNNNGKLRLSVRQASKAMGCAHNTAAKAFHALQAKGFIIQTQGACLGTEGMGKAPAYELTEMPAANEKGPGKQWFRSWEKGADFPVKMGASKPLAKHRAKTKARINNQDATVLKFETKR
jgi:DNA-binding transcriptional MocR family regulator